MNMRTLAAEAFAFRERLSNIASVLFGGKRDMYKALGYKRVLSPGDYRSRYRRNAVANRVVKALPRATWAGGFQVVEDDDPDVETTFEAAWADLEERLKVTQKFLRADILAGIGRYSIILIGAPGMLDTELLSASPEEISYLTPYAEEDALIEKYEIDPNNPRFGLPTYYTVSRTSITSSEATNSSNIGKRVHWTRVIHLADGLLDDNIYGEPRLECVWNNLDDLEKVTGGGAEAFWRRADQGRQFDVDPQMKIEPEAKEKLKKQLKEYEHDLRRDLFTRGVKVTTLGSDVADFSRPASSIIDQISAGTGIPQRILMGSERGHLASTQDRSNWDDRVEDRREEYAIPCIVRAFIDRMIELGVLPAPKASYDVEFSALRVMDDTQRAEIAGKWAAVNQSMGETVVTPDDIRTRVLELPSLSDAGVEPQAAPIAAAAKKGGGTWNHIHKVADRFRGARATYRQRLLRRSARRDQSAAAAQGPRRKGRFESID